LTYGDEDHAVESQKTFPVFYQSELIGNLTPDLIVNGKVIVDPEVVAGFNEAHIAQMISYLTITGLELAILLNLKSARSRMEACRPTTRAALRPVGPPRVKNLQPIRDIRVIRGSKTANCGSKKNSKKSLSDPGLFR
jgi:GxxExxY protein